MQLHPGKCAFDLDGVLCEKPPAAPKKWGQMNGAERRSRIVALKTFYMEARPSGAPVQEDTIVVTARKNSPDIVAITNHWFEKHFGFVPQIYFLDKARNIKNVAAHKASVISGHLVENYYEDSKPVLREMRKLYPQCNYFFVDENGNSLSMKK